MKKYLKNLSENLKLLKKEILPKFQFLLRNILPKIKISWKILALNQKFEF